VVQIIRLVPGSEGGSRPKAVARSASRLWVLLLLKIPSQRAQGAAQFVVRARSAEVTKQAGYCEFTRKRMSRQ
jgi:hypothetical protein